jgi:hypothetical protein
LRHALATREGVPCVLEWSPDFVVSVASRPLAEGGWVSTFEDITLRHRAQARMAWLVGHDALTGLPNRRDFVDWCAARLAYPERATQETGTRLALVRIDLVRFRQVHERRGQGWPKPCSWWWPSGCVRPVDGRGANAWPGSTATSSSLLR